MDSNCEEVLPIKYMVIDCNNDYFISEFDNYEEALNYYKDMVANISYDESVRLIQYSDLGVARYGK